MEENEELLFYDLCSIKKICNSILFMVVAEAKEELLLYLFHKESVNQIFIYGDKKISYYLCSLKKMWMYQYLLFMMVTEEN